MPRLFVLIALSLITNGVQAQIGQATLGIAPQLGMDSIAVSYVPGLSSLPAEQCAANCYSPLAVAGLELTARRQNINIVSLQWQTLTETNNKGFYVERSLGDIYTFQELGFVPGAGNSVQKLKYSLRDNNNFEGVSYYRIRQVDADGQINYSNIADVRGLYQNTFSITPNPAKNSCSLVFAQALNSKKAEVTIYDAWGRVALQQVYDNSANGIIRITTLPQLAAGVYMVSVSSGTNKFFGKLTISR
jgi:hypothetical protein